MHALIATGTPVVVIPRSGMTYALGSIVGEQGGEGAAAVVQACVPGHLGATALARVRPGAVNPSGRLTVSAPREPGSQPGRTSVRGWVAAPRRQTTTRRCCLITA